MPIFSDIALSSLTYNAAARTLTAVGVAFSDNQYSGAIYIRTGAEAFAAPAGSYVWGDSLVVLTLDSALTPGTYDAYIINGDGEQSATVAGAVVVSAAASMFFNFVTAANCK